jgi:hypothetical protein
MELTMRGVKGSGPNAGKKHWKGRMARTSGATQDKSLEEAAKKIKKLEAENYRYKRILSILLEE